MDCKRCRVQLLQSGFFDQLNQLGLRHLYFIVSLDRVTLGQFAAFGDRAVDVIRAKVQSDLCQALAQHHPVRFDVREVVEHQSRDGHCLQRIDSGRAGQVRELCVLGIKRERNETLEAARFVLLLAQANHVIDAIFNGFDVTIEHRRVCFQSGGVHCAGKIQPTLCIALMRTNH